MFECCFECFEVVLRLFEGCFEVALRLFRGCFEGCFESCFEVV